MTTDIILSDKQKEILSFMDRGYGMRKTGDDTVDVFTDTDRKIPAVWSKDIKPFHEMGLIKSHSFMLDVVYLNINDKGKQVLI